MNKNKTTKNSKGNLHGYQERYMPNGKIMLRCIYKNKLFMGIMKIMNLKVLCSI